MVGGIKASAGGDALESCLKRLIFDGCLSLFNRRTMFSAKHFCARRTVLLPGPGGAPKRKTKTDTKYVFQRFLKRGLTFAGMTSVAFLFIAVKAVVGRRTAIASTLLCCFYSQRRNVGGAGPQLGQHLTREAPTQHKSVGLPRLQYFFLLDSTFVRDFSSVLMLAGMFFRARSYVPPLYPKNLRPIETRGESNFGDF